MNADGQLKLLPALLAALALNALLLVSAAMLSRERPHRQDISEPVAVNLISLKETPPPPEEKPREIPKPEPRPELDFAPELTPPSLLTPALVGVQVKVNPSLLRGDLERGDFIFNSGDLDHPPQAVVRTPPVYPYRARQRRIAGEVEVKLLVRADGSVAQVEIMSARPEGVFEEAVRSAVPQWRFRPGVIDGRQVPSWVITKVIFDPSQ